MRKSKTANRPAIDAAMSGVRVPSVLFTDAPALSKARTTDVWPPREAQSTADAPSAVTAFTLAPAARRRATTSTWPYALACIKGDECDSVARAFVRGTLEVAQPNQCAYISWID